MASTTVNFNLKTAGYANYANQTLTFTLLSAGAEASSGTQDYVVLPGTVTATSDANGDGSATLFRTAFTRLFYQTENELNLLYPLEVLL